MSGRKYDLGWDYTQNLMTPERRLRLLRAAQGRTLDLRLVLDRVDDRHNISACLRTAEALGIHTVDLVAKSFRPSTPAKGASKWLQLNLWTDASTLIDSLAQQHFRIATAFPPLKATTSGDRPHYNLAELPVDGRLAVVFGNEHSGLSDIWKTSHHCSFHIEMLGLVESLNISVSCAIALYQIRLRQDRLRLDTAESPEESSPSGTVKDILDQWSAITHPRGPGM